MAPRAGVVNGFDFGLQFVLLAAADGCDEIRRVRLAAVALKGVQLLACGVICGAAAAAAGVVAAFTLDDQERARAAAQIDVRCLHALLARQVVEIDDHRNVARVHVGEVRVRRLAGVIPGEAAAAGDHTLRQRDLVAEDDVAQVVEDVRPPVAHFSVPGVPVPMPVVVQLLAVDRFVLRWAEPEVVVHGLRRCQRLVDFADGVAQAVVVAAHVFDLPDRSRVQEGLDLVL